MNTPKTLFVCLALSASFFFTGCGNSTMKKFEDIVNTVCACKDYACTQEAVKAIAKLEDFKPSKSESEKLIELNTKKTVCIDNLVATKNDQ